MRFADVIADGGIKARLSEMADSGMLGHALMLHEDEGGGALALTVALAQYLLCKDHKDGDSCGTCNTCSRVERLIYPDLHFVFPVNSGTKRGTDKKPTSDTYMAEWRALYAANPYFSEQQLYNALGIENKSGVIAVAESRKIIEKLTLTALEGYYKIMVVWLPERMNAEAANKLLKILEEPYDGTLFVLITHAPEKVMTTIASRCRCLRVPPMDTGELAACPFRFGAFQRSLWSAGGRGAGCRPGREGEAEGFLYGPVLVREEPFPCLQRYGSHSRCRFFHDGLFSQDIEKGENGFLRQDIAPD